MQMPMPDDWDGVSTCRWAVCWPDSVKWRAILSGLIEMPNQGRFWDFSTGDFLDLREQFKPVYDYNFDLKGVIMACEDTGIADALNNIAVALTAQAQATVAASASATASGGCGCQGSGGAGQYDPPPATNTDGNHEIDPPPDGYESWEDFDNQRCGVVRDILDNVRNSLVNMSGIAFGSISVEALIEVLLVLLTLAISSAGVAAIAALLLSVTAIVVLTSALNIINDNENDLICALLSGSDSVSSRTAFLSKFGEFVDAGVSDPIENFAIKTLMGFLVTISETNRMYTADYTMDWPTSDCPTCEPECFFFEDDLQGFFAQEGSMPNFYSPPGATVAWDSGEMVMTSVIDGGTSYAFAWSPDIDHEIVTGDTLCIEVSLIDHTTFSSYVAAVIDGTPTAINSASGSETERANTYSLDPYAGQVLNSYSFGWGKSGAFVINIASTGVNCPACAE